jgi:hypothetical protein
MTQLVDVTAEYVLQIQDKHVSAFGQSCEQYTTFLTVECP